MIEIIYLSTEDLLHLAARIGVLEVRDMGLLDSAAMRPQSVVFGTESYPMLADKAAALMESIVGNHPLVDGNKRLGLAAVVLFYEMNGVPLKMTNDQAYDFTIKVASGKAKYIEIAQQLAEWTNSTR